MRSALIFITLICLNNYISKEAMHVFFFFVQSNNDAIKESESSIGKTRNTIWEETKPFPNAEFRVYTVWLSNFSGSEEEFALASRVITHGTVIWNMKIRPSSSSTTKKSEIKAAIAKLKELPKCHNYFRITCSDEALVEPSLW